MCRCLGGLLNRIFAVFVVLCFSAFYFHHDSPTPLPLAKSDGQVQVAQVGHDGPSLVVSTSTDNEMDGRRVNTPERSGDGAPKSSEHGIGAISMGATPKTTKLEQVGAPIIKMNETSRRLVSCPLRKCEYYTKKKHACTLNERSLAKCQKPSCGRFFEKVRLASQAVTSKRLRLLFIGDSTSEQLFSTFLCRLLSCGISSRYDEAKSCYSAEKLPISVCYQKRGYAGRPPVFEHLTQMMKEGDVHKGDVLILNEGIHYRFVRGDSEVGTLQKTILTKSKIRSLYELGVHIFWRETLPQHFATQSGAYEGAQKKSVPCMAIKDASRVLQRNAVVNDLMKKADIPILPALQSSMQAFDQHLAERNPGRGVNGQGATQVDCTHFCEPSLILEQLTDSLIDTLVTVL